MGQGDGHRLLAVPVGGGEGEALGPDPGHRGVGGGDGHRHAMGRLGVQPDPVAFRDPFGEAQQAGAGGDLEPGGVVIGEGDGEQGAVGVARGAGHQPDGLVGLVDRIVHHRQGGRARALTGRDLQRPHGVVGAAIGRARGGERQGELSGRLVPAWHRGRERQRPRGLGQAGGIGREREGRLLVVGDRDLEGLAQPRVAGIIARSLVGEGDRLMPIVGVLGG